MMISAAIMAAGADTPILRVVWTVAFCANVILSTIGGKR